VSKHVSGGKGSASERQGKGGSAGRHPGGNGKNAGKTSGGSGRDRPSKGWGATGGPAGKAPPDGGFLNWILGGGK